MVTITVGGRIFRTVKAAAEHYGAHYGNTARRVRAGWSPEEALGLVPHRKKGSGGVMVVTSRGTFPSIQAASQHFGLEYGTIQARLAKGWAADESCGILARKQPPKAGITVRCRGNAYPNIEAFADAYKLAYKLVYKRLHSGWTPEQAVNLSNPPPRFRNFQGHARKQHWKAVQTIDGRRLPGADAGEYKVYVIRNERSGMEYVGITVNDLKTRLRGHFALAAKGRRSHIYNAIRHYGRGAFSIELVRSDANNYAELQAQEVAEIRRRDTIRNGYNTAQGGSIGTSKPITIAGIRFSSHGAAAERYGIDPAVFNLRVNRLAWTPEQAAEIQPRPKFARHKVIDNGRTFKSLKAAAEAHGLNWKKVHDRVVKGWTVEQALETAVAPESVRFRGLALSAFGRAFTSFGECARHFGIKPESLRNRVRNYGDAVEAAIQHLQTNPRPGRQRDQSKDR